MPAHKNDGRKMEPNGPKHLNSPVKLADAKGKDAGGTDNMKADGTKMRCSHAKSGGGGNTKFRPAGVTVHSGVAAPSSIAKSPK